MEIRIKKEMTDCWSKTKILVNPETKEKYPPIIKDDVAHYNVPRWYAEKLLKVEPVLFCVADSKSPAKPAEKEKKEKKEISKMGYRELQKLYTVTTGKRAVGVSREVMERELKDGDQ